MPMPIVVGDENAPLHECHNENNLRDDDGRLFARAADRIRGGTPPPLGLLSGLEQSDVIG